MGNGGELGFAKNAQPNQLLLRHAGFTNFENSWFFVLGGKVNQTSRIYFLDALRAFAVVLVVVLHGSMGYIIGVPEWWYVIDNQSNLYYTILSWCCSLISQ